MQFTYLFIIGVGLEYIGGDIVKNAVHIHVDCCIFRDVVAV